MTVDLRLGDCLYVMRTLEALSVDLVVTSPPFNLGNSPCAVEHPTRGAGPTSALKWRGYASSLDRMLEVEYQAWQLSCLAECHRVVRETGAVCYQHCDRFIEGHLISPLTWLAKSTFILRQQIVWDKRKTHRWDGFYFAPSHEYVFWLTKQGWNTNAFRRSIRRWRSVWDIPGETYPGHPAVFPVELARRCIEALTLPGDTVLDPFMGTGTTGVAAILTGRDFIGIEIDPGYFEIAKRRIAEAGAQPSLLEVSE